MTVTNGVDVTRLGDAVDAIAAAPDTGRFTFRAKTEWTDGLQSVTSIGDFERGGERHDAREFRLTGDEPEALLGDRTGPSPIELLLAAVGSCLSVSYAANAAAMGIEITTLRLELTGDIDVRGFLGISESVRAGCDSVTCTVSVDADASPADLAALRDRVEAGSPVLDSLSNVVPIETDVAMVDGGESE